MRIWALRTIAFFVVGTALSLAFVGQCLADESASAVWFNKLGVGSKAQIQMDLIVTGFYGDSVDAKFGPATYAALTKFQASMSQSDSGVLTYSQRKQLRTQAVDTLQGWGMQKVGDDQLGAEFVVPRKLLPFETKDGTTNRYTTADGSVSLVAQRVSSTGHPYEALYIEAIGRVDSALPNYLRFRPDFWIVSGHADGTMFYSMMRKAADGSSVGFTVNADSTHSDEGGRLAVYEAARFTISDPVDLTVQTASAEPPVDPLGPVTPAGEELLKPSSTPDLASSTEPPDEPPSAPPDEPPSAPPQHGVLPSGVAGPVRPAGNEPIEHPSMAPGPSASQVASLEDETIGPFKLLASDPTTIILDGQIDEQTPLEFMRVLRERPNATAIVLNSPGGQVDGGLIVASQVHDRNMITYVPKEAGCYSACSFILFAGTKRLVEGELGVHQISMEQHGSGDLVTGQMKLSDIIDALNDYGVDERVVSLMLRTAPADMHVFKSQELVEFGINN